MSEYSGLFLHASFDPTDSPERSDLPPLSQYDNEQYLEDGAEPMGYVELPDDPGVEPADNLARMDDYFRGADGKLWRRWTH
jgi:hypothetical protein